MSAQNRGLHTLKVKFAVISGLVAVLFVSVVMLSQWLAIPDPSTQVADLPVVQILNDAQMKQITGGWLAGTQGP